VVVALMSTLIVASTISPASATFLTGGYKSCGGSNTVHTYNYAAGYIVHSQQVTPYVLSDNFGGSYLPPAVRYRNWDFPYVNGWSVYGTMQANPNSGVACLT
jgi:hypothetical protein